MIIKTEYGSGWRFDDHVSKVEVFHPDTVPNTARYEDTLVVEIVQEGDEAPRRQIVSIHGVLDGGETIGVMSNRAVYLLEDGGKTIERLN